MAPDLLISISDIELFEKSNGQIPQHSLFLAYTGWSQFWNDPDRYRNPDETGKMHFPGFSEEAALFLKSCKNPKPVVSFIAGMTAPA